MQSRGLPGESGDVARVGGHVEDAEQTVAGEPEPAGRREVRGHRMYRNTFILGCGLNKAYADKI